MLALLKRLVGGPDPKTALVESLGDAPIPTLRKTALDALQALRDPGVALTRIGEVISSDPGLTVGILRAANCGSGPSRKVADVRHATVVLGRAQVEARLLRIAVQEALPQGDAPGFDHGRYWRTAQKRASIAREIAHVVEPANATVAATVGLLQDLAVPLLAHRRPREYGPVLESWQRDGGDLEARERDAFPWAHSDVGGWLCSSWGLPEHLGALISGHHAVDEAPPSVALVSLLSERGDEKEMERLVETARSRFGVPPDKLLAAVERAERRPEA
jgi:HD-like signal output (HDOD) protein